MANVNKAKNMLHQFHFYYGPGQPPADEITRLYNIANAPDLKLDVVIGVSGLWQVFGCASKGDLNRFVETAYYMDAPPLDYSFPVDFSRSSDSLLPERIESVVNFMQGRKEPFIIEISGKSVTVISDRGGYEALKADRDARMQMLPQPIAKMG